MPVKITILGVSGRMGHALVGEIAIDRRYALHGGIVRSDSEYDGTDIGVMSGVGYADVSAVVRIEEAAKGADVVIDAVGRPETFDQAFKAREGRLPSEYAVQGYDTARALAEPRAVQPPLALLEQLQGHSYQLLGQLSAIKSMLLLGGGAAGMATEAAIARDALLALGIPANAPLVIEDRSRDTLQNLRNARQLLQADAGWNGRVTLLSSRYHLARCRQFARQLGLTLQTRRFPLAVPHEPDDAERRRHEPQPDHHTPVIHDVHATTRTCCSREAGHTPWAAVGRSRWTRPGRPRERGAD